MNDNTSDLNILQAISIVGVQIICDILCYILVLDSNFINICTFDEIISDQTN